jgi:hypothetical protein
MMMNDEDRKMIEEVERLDAKATPGPWASGGPEIRRVADTTTRWDLLGGDWENWGSRCRDATFIARARELLPALAKRLREVSTDLRTREAALVALEKEYMKLVEARDALRKSSDALTLENVQLAARARMIRDIPRTEDASQLLYESELRAMAAAEGETK